MECANSGRKRFHLASIGGVAVAVTRQDWRATPNNCGFVDDIYKVSSVINGDNNN